MSRALFTAARKKAYEALHPETVHGGDRRSSRQLGDLKETDRFTAETAARTGRSERAVQRCGELLESCPKSLGGRPVQTTEGALRSLPTRGDVAAEAGLSEHQQKEALRVAAVPTP